MDTTTATTAYSSRSTETRKADTLSAGDRILDPESRKPRILSIYRVERLGNAIYLDGMIRRSVTRKVAPWQDVEVVR
jgi:hypothetical protein